MEFDKSRVYTALNADELKVGSTAIVADTMAALKKWVSNYRATIEYRIIEILSEENGYRFKTTNGNTYAFVYLIAPPKETEYKPFSDTETAFKTITAHGGWVKYENTYFLIHGISIGREDFKEILVGRVWHSAKEVFDACVFTDDGTPVGEKVEDDDNNA